MLKKKRGGDYTAVTAARLTPGERILTGGAVAIDIGNGRRSVSVVPSVAEPILKIMPASEFLNQFYRMVEPDAHTR